ncbi:MAG: hypothetical protein KDB05_05725 [Planctomycetales bacterium]|nr:hypothetical protein [Planctomycetales bacterium]
MIEQDADKLLMLYRESEYYSGCKDPDPTEAWIRKNRLGPTGCVELDDLCSSDFSPRTFRPSWHHHVRAVSFRRV